MNKFLKEFSDNISLAGIYFTKHDYEKAEQVYLKLVDLYSKICEKSSVNDALKAHLGENITHVYNKLYVNQKINATKKKFNFPNLYIVCVFVLIFVLSFFAFYEPSITGNVVLFPAEIQEFVNLTFTRGGEYKIPLVGNPTSFKVTGFVSGNGIARFYIADGKNLHLVYDNERILENPFANACLNSCSFSDFNTTSLSVIVELIDDVVLTVSDITYTAVKPYNHPPEWRGPTSFNIKDKTEIDLSKYFHDVDGNKLVFLSTGGEGLDVSIFDNIAVITPEKGVSGEKNVLFIASDFIDVTRMPVTIRVE